MIRRAIFISPRFFAVSSNAAKNMRAAGTGGATGIQALA